MGFKNRFNNFNKIVLLSLLFCISIAVNAQQGPHSIWMFGQNSGVNFNGGVPVYQPGNAMNNIEGVASICDNSGNLLFYTNSINVWNRNHVLMPNGFGLAGDVSMSQLLIEKQPGNPNIYYILYAGIEGSTMPYSYSIVDMSLSGGLGNVTVKNFVIQPNIQYCEKITSVYHNNGVDKWILTKQHGNATWMAFLLNSSGLLSWSATVTSYTVSTVFGTKIGCVKANAQGTKVAATYYGSNRMSILDFNNQTGFFSNEISIAMPNGPYGLEFSPSGRFLYVSFNNGSFIYQYDMCAPNIAGSRITIATNAGLFVGSFQRGPDGRIYIAQNNSLFLHRINNPDVQGISCNLQFNVVPLVNISRFGLPQFCYPPGLNPSLSPIYHN